MTQPHGAVRRAVLDRRSIGRVRPDPVAADIVEDLIAAALRAPNHHLTHPWRFIVLSGQSRRVVGAAHAAALSRKRDGLDREAEAKETARLERAPIVIVCISRSKSDDPTLVREDRDAVAAGVQNLLLVAAERGLGAIWRTGTMVDEPEVRVALGLHAKDEAVAFVYLGWPVDPSAGAITRRPSVAEVTEWRSPRA